MRQFKRLDQRVDLGIGVVHPEGRAAGGGLAQMLHQRPATMLTRTYRHALFIKNGRDIMRIAPPRPV